MTPVIDIAPLIQKSNTQTAVAEAIGKACRDTGFFYIKNHGVDEALQTNLLAASRKFFALDQKPKMKMEMKLAGSAWRGYFPIGSELTSGLPDQKEGIYFGEELGPDHPTVVQKTPMHGANLFPQEIPEMKNLVLKYMDSMTELGHALMRGLALSLSLDANYFHDRYTADPLILFRIFNYPPTTQHWGVGEHSDYGVLTILKQDELGGLEIKSKEGWIEAPPIRGTFVCNIGDMLDRMTKGLYRSTPHRVKNVSGKQRLSLAFFFDPNFDAQVKPIDLKLPVEFKDDRDERWDKASVHAFQGTYGDYLLTKVSKVFPQLAKKP